MKKFAALLLALTMVLGMATITASAEGSERVITIGTTWDLYWDSFDGSIEDNPYYSGTTADEMMFAKVKQIEDKWNVKFEYINLTYAGAKESINTSVLAGTPDVDVYMLDLALAAPAAANGYVTDLRDVLPADNAVIQGKDAVPGDYFMNFVMSNGTNVAATATENLSSPEVGEVLQFIQDLNLVDKVMYPIPEENGWDVCRWLYRDGKVAFTPIAAWIMDSNKDYAFQSPDSPTLDFDTVFIPWPVGPHGNAETNAQKVTANSCYVIPVGVEDPELVYNVLYDLLNWYNYDPNSEDGGAAALAIRDDPETLGWWYGVTAKDIDLQDYNFEVMMEMGRHQMLDRYGSLGDDAELPLREFINGDYTTAQLQEKYRQTIQDAIDGILGK